MTRIQSNVLMVCLSLLFGMGVDSYAGIPKAPAKTKEEQTQIMKTHMEKVKIKNPAKYDSMLKNAGGSVKECKDCHIEEKDEKKTP
jgi:hypothetical protein